MKKLIILFIVSFIPSTNSLKAQGDTPYVGQIAYVAFNFAPQGWAECNGQLLPISENEVLFALIGTTYGGDGQTTFALPDTRGRIILGNGQGPGLSNYTIGEKGGSESVNLNINQMPSHSHSVNAVLAEGNDSSPTGNLPANTNASDKEYSSATPDTVMGSQMLQTTGGNLPHENRPPFIALKCIIAVQGIFPSRN